MGSTVGILKPLSMPHAVGSFGISSRHKFVKQRKIRLLLSPVIQIHSGRLYRHSRDPEPVHPHSAERPVVRGDDRGDRRTHEGKKTRSSLIAHDVEHFPDLLHHLLITAENCVQIAKPGREDRAPLTAPARLIKAADISGTAACVYDHYESAHLKKHLRCSRNIGRER